MRIDFWRYRRGTTGARLVADYAVEHGMAMSDVLVDTGLQAQDLSDPDKEILAAQELAVIRNVLDNVPDARLNGFAIGERFHFTAYGLWGLGIVSCPTYGEALAMALRFLPMTYAFSDITLKLTDGQAIIAFTAPALDADISAFLVDRDMSATVLLMIELLAGQLRIIKVSRMPVPPDAPRPDRAIRELPMDWNADLNGIHIDPQALEIRMPYADSSTAAMCAQMCEMMLDRRLVRSDLSQNVRGMLEFASNKFPQLEAVASHFHMSERTLKRKLAASGTTFSKLLDETRRKRALTLLNAREASLSDIADQLGYSDLSSFSQAFKRWYGQSPRNYRHSL